MEMLWAPWRIEYILNEKPAGCICCLPAEEVEDRENLVLCRTLRSFAMLNRYPYTNGHLMVSPLRHVGDLNQLTSEEMIDLFMLVRESCNALKSAASPDGINIGMNLGRAAGAGVEEHLHIHIVPRWNGDTNFMAVMADVRVMPENLQASYDRLKPLFA